MTLRHDTRFPLCNETISLHYTLDLGQRKDKGPA